MGEGELAIPGEVDWELLEAEAKTRLYELDDYGDALPADVASRIRAAAQSVLSAYSEAPDQLDDRLAELRACVGPLLELVEAARRERDATFAAAIQANPNKRARQPRVEAHCGADSDCHAAIVADAFPPGSPGEAYHGAASCSGSTASIAFGSSRWASGCEAWRGEGGRTFTIR